MSEVIQCEFEERWKKQPPSLRTFDAFGRILKQIQDEHAKRPESIVMHKYQRVHDCQEKEILEFLHQNRLNCAKLTPR